MFLSLIIIELFQSRTPRDSPDVALVKQLIIPLVYIYIIYLYIFFILIYNYHNVLLHGMFVSKTHSLFLLSAVTTLYVTKNHSAISYIFRSRRRLFVFTLPIENYTFFFLSFIILHLIYIYVMLTTLKR